MTIYEPSYLIEIVFMVCLNGSECINKLQEEYLKPQKQHINPTHSIPVQSKLVFSQFCLQ